MKTYYHWTERRNLKSIGRNGMQGRYALGRMKVVWCFRKGSEAPAMRCVLKHHMVNPLDLVLLKIKVEPNDLRLHCDGLYYCKSDIPADRVEVVGQFKRG